MRSRTEILEIISEEMEDVLGTDPGTINEETRLVEDLQVDSLDEVELIMGLEHNHGISITDEEAYKVKTVKDIIDIIQAKD